MTKTLSELLTETVVLNIDWNELPPETKIKQVAYDSRAVKPGGLFVAIPGFRYDGHEFIPDAIANGAAAVVLEQPTTRLPAGVAKVIVPDSREALPDIAANFYDYPSRKQKVGSPVRMVRRPLLFVRSNVPAGRV